MLGKWTLGHIGFFHFLYHQAHSKFQTDASPRLSHIVELFLISFLAFNLMMPHRYCNEKRVDINKRTSKRINYIVPTMLGSQNWRRSFNFLHNERASSLLGTGPTLRR